MSTWEAGTLVGVRYGLQWIDDLYNRPVYGDHNPLVLGWGDDQLKPFVDLLQQRLPDGLTTRMRFAIAAVALSLVIEKKRSDNPLRYARAKEPYGIPKRYRTNDRYHTWQCLTKSMSVLQQVGLIGHDLGVWGPGQKGRQSVAWATEQLVELLEASAAGLPERIPSTATEVIVLRDRVDKRVIDYTDSAETEMMRAQVETINQELGKLQLFHGGELLKIPTARRIFNGDFSRGGRLYCGGPSFQNIRAAQRADLQLVIDGVLRPMVEVDYSNLHITMAYTEARERMPKGDQYAIPRFDRDLVKMALNTVLNARSRSTGVSAIEEELYGNPTLRKASGLTTHRRQPCWNLAKKVAAAIEAKHWRIRSYFGSDCGARYQRQDSDMAVQIILRMIQKTGRCPLPMHDSFLVADVDREDLAQTMTEVAAENRLPLRLRDSRGRQWAPATARRTPVPRAPSFHLEVRNTDLGKWRGLQGEQSAVGCQLRKAVGADYAHVTMFRRLVRKRGPPA